MGIWIQPRDIEVTDEDPFRHDLLGRKQPVEILTHLVGSIEGPCVIAVDAAWGTGKTTFLKMWAQHLRNNEFPVVEFNAWETDFAGDPFVALSTELTEGLRSSKNKDLQDRLDRMMKLVKKVVRSSVPIAIRCATMGTLGLQASLEKEIGQYISSLLENRLSEYKETRKALQEFRKSLQHVVNTLAESKQRRPLVIIIDELDRCRPLYAVELLEAAKHLYSVDGIAFVLALNRSELAHSVKSLYGVEFDGIGYLSRFFDVEFRLPDPDRERFIERALDAVRISDFFKRTKDSNAWDDSEESIVRDWLKRFFGSHDFSLRRIAKSINHLGLVFASLPSQERSFGITAVVALILRTVDPNIYYKFVCGEASDLQVVDRILDRNSGLSEMQHEYDSFKFEAMIILAYLEVSGVSGEFLESPLWRKYEDLSGNEPLDPSIQNFHALEVVRCVNRLTNGKSLGIADLRRRFGFMQTVQRLELLSPSLIRQESRADSRDS